MNVLPLIIVLIFMIVIGGGGMLLLYFKSKPKRLTWTAKCYQVGEGIKKVKQNIDGEEELILRLKDLVPYVEDVLIKKDLAIGKTVYELKTLGLTTNAVTADMVDVWGKEKKEVHVLIEGSTATVLKYGYDVKSGNVVFTPMPRERIELVTSEIAVKQARLKKDNTNLAALTTWVIVGMAVLGLVAVSYFMGQGFIKSGELNRDAAKILADANKDIANTYREASSNLRQIDLESFKYQSSNNNIQDNNITTTDSDIIR